MMLHELKLAKEYYKESETNAKTFEIRKNNRAYKIGDILMLKEYDTSNDTYTGNFHYKGITYILDNEQYLAPEYVCLGLMPMSKELAELLIKYDK